MNIRGLRCLTVIVILLCWVNNIVLPAQQTRFMYDGERRIYYTDVEDAEGKLLEYIKIHNGMWDFPSKFFADLVLRDERCFDYDFSKLQEASSKVTMRSLEIVESDDGKLRLYTWDADGGTMSNYSGITSYKNESGIHSYASLIGEERDTYDEKDQFVKTGIIACGATDVKTLRKNDGSKVYVVFSHASASTLIHCMSLSAYTLSANGFNVAKVFPEESVSISLPSYYQGPDSDFSPHIELDGNELRIPEQLVEDTPYCCPVTGRNLVYRFDGEKFRFYKIAYGDNLCEDLCNYQYNIITINADPWIIRIDKMPDGATRYASWKNKAETERPDLVIANGYCALSELVESKTSGKWMAQASKEEKYIFQNKDYFYEVSYASEVGYESIYLHSWKLVVKRNDKILMTLKSIE